MKSFSAIRQRLHELERAHPDGKIRPPDALLLEKARQIGLEAEFKVVCGVFERVEWKRPAWADAEIAELRAKLRSCRRRRRASAEEASTTLQDPTPAARLVAC